MTIGAPVPMGRETLDLGTQGQRNDALRAMIVGNLSVSSVQVRFPGSIPHSQLYYWTRSWQENEAAALDEIERGDSVTFDSADDAIRWLLSGDE